MDGKQITFSPNPYKGGFYKFPFSFACVIPQSQHVPACSLCHLNTKTHVRILFSICSTKTKALFSLTQLKRNRKYKPVKRTLLSDKFSTTDCWQELFFSFLSFTVNTSFYNIFIRIWAWVPKTTWYKDKAIIHKHLQLWSFFFPFSASCIRMAPHAILLASVVRVKSWEKSGNEMI